MLTKIFDPFCVVSAPEKNRGFHSLEAFFRGPGGEITGTYKTQQRKMVSAAWQSGLEHRFYDAHGRKVNGSTPNPVTLLCT